MSKQMLAEAVARATDCTKAQANAAVDAVFTLIEQQIRDTGEFKLTGFGSWTRKARAEAQGRNPRTGDEVTIPAGHRLNFKPGATLKAGIVPPAPVAASRKRKAA